MHHHFISQFKLLPSILLLLTFQTGFLQGESFLEQVFSAPQVAEPPLRAQAIQQILVVPKRLTIRQPADWPRGWGKTYTEGKYFVIDGLDRFLLDGAPLRGDMSQKEGQESMIHFHMDRVVFRRWRIANSKESIHYLGNYQVHQNNVHVNVGEDAVSAIEPCRNLSIVGNDFAGGRKYDKIIQLNHGKGHVVQGNTFRRCLNALRAMDAQVHARGNWLFNVDMGYYASRSKGLITFEPLTERYENVKTLEIEASNGGVVSAVGADGKKLKKK